MSHLKWQMRILLVRENIIFDQKLFEHQVVHQIDFNFKEAFHFWVCPEICARKMATVLYAQIQWFFIAYSCFPTKCALHLFLDCFVAGCMWPTHFLDRIKFRTVCWISKRYNRRCLLNMDIAAVIDL